MLLIVAPGSTTETSPVTLSSLLSSSLSQAKNEKTRRVTQAEAAAAEKKLAAAAEAYQISVESKARADAIKREASALKGNPALIQLRMAEKWNGELPKFNSGNSIPMFDATAILSNKKDS